MLKTIIIVGLTIVTLVLVINLILITINLKRIKEIKKAWREES